MYQVTRVIVNTYYIIYTLIQHISFFPLLFFFFFSLMRLLLFLMMIMFCAQTNEKINNTIVINCCCVCRSLISSMNSNALKLSVFMRAIDIRTCNLHKQYAMQCNYYYNYAYCLGKQAHTMRTYLSLQAPAIIKSLQNCKHILEQKLNKIKWQTTKWLKITYSFLIFEIQ